MYRCFVQIFLVLVFIFFGVVSVSAQQIPPRSEINSGEIIVIPGQNCGVAGKDGVNKCCISDIQKIKFPDDYGDIPVASGIIEGIMGWVNGRVKSIPFIILPDEIIALTGLPTVGTAQKAFEDLDVCMEGVPEYTQQNGGYACTCTFGDNAASLTKLYKLCQNVKSDKERDSCLKCLSGTYESNEVVNDQNVKIGGIWTGLGCLPVSSPKAFIEKTVFGIGLSLAAVAALLCLIFAAFQLQISRGNPERIKKNQELLTSCIMGLMLIIFSIFILRLIGVEILRLPGFE